MELNVYQHDRRRGLLHQCRRVQFRRLGVSVGDVTSCPCPAHGRARAARHCCRATERVYKRIKLGANGTEIVNVTPIITAIVQVDKGVCVARVSHPQLRLPLHAAVCARATAVRST